MSIFLTSRRAVYGIWVKNPKKFCLWFTSVLHFFRRNRFLMYCVEFHIFRKILSTRNSWPFDLARGSPLHLNRKA